jgi:magnesium transporter
VATSDRDAGARESRGKGSVLGVALDFERKTEEPIDAAAARETMGAGRFVWLDVDVGDPDAARRALAELGALPPDLVEDALGGEPATQTARYEGCRHIVVTGCTVRAGHLELQRVDVVIGERFLLTAHRGPVAFLDAMRRDYHDDFVRFAKSPSFLVYELWEHLLDGYLGAQKRFEERVERVQAELIGDIDDRIFARISELGADLLHFRKVLLPARAVLTELSTRKSPYVSEATQTFLGNMVGTVERVLQDLLVDRDIVAQSVNLHVSMVGHRTNRVMNRLTVVSVIFLPLTFLCGVYGMNFEVLPETKWRYGYLSFWVAVALIVVGLVWLLRRNGLI